MRKRFRGRILAVKLGVNPNSSSLGTDVTFLLFGVTALSLITPFLGALLRGQRTLDKAIAGNSRAKDV